jgi:prepilin-type processing-associated H-X9-DG protein
MLLPALSKARDAAKSIRCVSNLKQLGLSMNAYCENYEGVLPRYFVWYRFIDENVMGGEYDPADASTQKFEGWRETLLCPGQKASDFVAGGFDYKEGRISYGYNYTYIGLNTPFRLSKVKRPAGMILLADTNPSTPGDYGYITRWDDAFAPISNRHNGGANVLWCDLHVEWVKRADIVGGIDIRNKYWDPYTR